MVMYSMNHSSRSSKQPLVKISNLSNLSIFKNFGVFVLIRMSSGVYPNLFFFLINSAKSGFNASNVEYFSVSE